MELVVKGLKKQRAYKPGSVLLPKEKCLSFISTDGRPSALATYPPASGELPYMRRCTWSCNPSDVRTPGVAIGAVGSYPAFSPLPSLTLRRLFSVTFPLPFDNFPLGSMVLCVARTFLLSCEKRQTGSLFRSKITHKMSDMGFSRHLKPVSLLVKSR